MSSSIILFLFLVFVFCPFPAKQYQIISLFSRAPHIQFKQIFSKKMTGSDKKIKLNSQKDECLTISRKAQKCPCAFVSVISAKTKSVQDDDSGYVSKDEQTEETPNLQMEAQNPHDYCMISTSYSSTSSNILKFNHAGSDSNRGKAIKMLSDAEAFFVKKQYEIYVDSITLEKDCSLHFFSANSGVSHKQTCPTTIQIKKQFSIASVDVIYKAVTNCDKEIKLQIDLSENAMASVSFDLSKQKIKKLQSTALFKKALSIPSAFIYYKFVSCHTSLLHKDQIEDHLLQKGEVIKQIVQQQKQVKIEKEGWKMIIAEKNRNIQQLETKIQKLRSENSQLRRKNDEYHDRLSKGLSIQTNLKCLNEVREMQQNKYLYLQKVRECERKMATLSEQNQSLYERINHFMEGGYEEQVFSQTLNSDISKEEALNIQKQKEGYTGSISEISRDKTGQLYQSSKKDTKQQLADNTLPTQQILQAGPSSPLLSKTEKKKEDPGENSHSLTELAKAKEGKSQIKGERKEVSLKLVDEHRVETSISFDNNSPAGDNKLALQVQTLKVKLTAKSKEIAVLEEHIAKKDKEVQRLKEKEVIFNKNLKFLQNEKASLLSNLALNTAKATDNIDTLTALKQITNYNKELLKQKDSFLQEIELLRRVAEQTHQTIDNYKKKNSRAEICIEELLEERSLLEKDLRNSKVSSFREGTMPESYVSKFKHQLAACQKELSKAKQEQVATLQEKQRLQQQLKEQEGLREGDDKEREGLKKQIEVLNYQKKYLAAGLTKLKEEYEDSLSLNRRYLEMENKFGAINKTAVKVESQFNKRVKKDDIQFYKKEMEKVIGMLFVSINDFQVDFYSNIESSFKVSSLSLQQYYKALIEAQTEKYNKLNSQIKGNSIQDKKLSSEQLKEFQRKKKELEKEKLAKDKEMQEQKKILQIKKQSRLLTLDQELKSFEDGIQFVDNKLVQLLQYKNDISAFFGSQTFKYMEVPDKIGKPFKEQLSQDLAESKIFSNSFQDVKEITIKEIDEEEEGQNNFDLPDSKISQNRRKVGQESFDGKESMKKTMQKKNKLSFLDYRTGGLSKLGTSINIKKGLMKETLNPVESKMFGTYLNNSSSSIMTFKQALEVSKELIKERIKAREIKIQSIKQTSTLTTNLYQQKINKDMIVVKHQEREWELQRQYEKLKFQSQMEAKVLNKKIISLEEAIKAKDLQISQKVLTVQQFNLINDQLLQAETLLQQAEKEKQGLKEQIYELLGTIGKYKDKETDMAVELELIRSSFDQKGETLQQLIQNKISFFEHAEQEKDKEIDQLKTKIERLKEEVETEYQRSMTDNKEKEKIISQLSHEVNHQTAEYAELQQFLTTFLQEGRQIEEERLCLEEENIKLREGLRQLAQRIQDLEQELLRTSRKLETAEKERETLQDLEASLQEQMQRVKLNLEQALQQQSFQLKRWEDSYCKLQVEVQMAARYELKAREEAEKLKSNEQGMSRRIKEQQMEILAMQGQMSAQTLKMEQLIEANEFLDKLGKRVGLEKDGLQAQNQRLRQQLLERDNKKNMKCDMLTSCAGKRATSRMNSLGSHDITYTSPLPKKKDSLTQQMIIQDTVEEINQEITYMTPLLQLLPEDDNYREFEMHSPADLIQEILSLREEKAELHREVEVANKKLKEVELVCNLAEELRQKLRKREMEAKELRSEKAGLEVRLKQAEKNAIRLKTALSEQEGKANARVQQLLHYSQLSGQFHRNSQLQEESFKCCLEID